MNALAGQPVPAAGSATRRPPPAFLRGAREMSPALSLLLILPFLGVLLLAFLLPIGVLVHESLFVPAPTLRHYARVFDDPVYLRVLWRTLRISALVTLITLVLAYPLAVAMARARGAVLTLLAACVMLPLWTSVLVRTYAWTVLMRRNGLINQTLQALGIVDEPVRLLYTEGAVILAMAHVLLPFMVLPIWVALRGIPGDYARAAAVLGAPPWRGFLEVTLPLSRPGVASGCLMVFLLALGFFVTPALVGGPQQMMAATLISQQVRELLNWPFAGALVGCLLLLTLAIVAVFNRAMRLDRFVSGA
jgi:mannopine transport system permease protein